MPPPLEPPPDGLEGADGRGLELKLPGLREGEDGALFLGVLNSGLDEGVRLAGARVPELDGLSPDQLNNEFLSRLSG